jgi:cyclopropane-fatty-acyl-phospholipid synthase
LNGTLHSKERDRQAVDYHYSVSNDFYALWLDRRMVYSCAYFASSDTALDEAQEQKLDYICRKLRLRPGQRFLDIGCGWGGLVIHASSRYGVDALGVTLSQAQADLANERIAQAGLSARCRVEVRDYRDLDKPSGFDRMASVGMFEHVGERMLPQYFRQAWQLLRPGGVFLNHGIAFTQPQPPSRGPTFFDRYVFPDGELVTLSGTLRAAESTGFEVRDVESLREHYWLTLRQWIRRLESRHEEVRRIADEVTFRVWRLYMAAGAHQFASGRTTLYQTLLCKPDRGATELPLTRSDWYA